MKGVLAGSMALAEGESVFTALVRTYLLQAIVRCLWIFVREVRGEEVMRVITWAIFFGSNVGLR